MNSLLLISPAQGSGFKPILSGKFGCQVIMLHRYNFPIALLAETIARAVSWRSSADWILIISGKVRRKAPDNYKTPIANIRSFITKGICVNLR
ncbi:hypothetical protein [Microcoleus sp. N9_A1]|uniref:hypothetical protein n=1 Tax=Microcoleus sp. N9_A1 TaxID=3055380 RepID=UPI002FD5B1F1